MESLIDSAVARPRFTAWLVGLFAGTALLLTIVGLRCGQLRGRTRASEWRAGASARWRSQLLLTETACALKTPSRPAHPAVMAAAAMRYREYPLHPALAPFVKCVWSLESADAIFEAPPERILPDGCVELVFHFASPFRSGYGSSPKHEQPRSLVVGQMRRFIEIQPQGRVGFVAVRFHVRGAYLFFPGPLSEIANRDVALEHVWGCSAHEVADRIAGARDMEARVSVIETALLGQVRQSKADRLVDRALHLIELQGGQINVTELAPSLGASTRQLGRRFNATVGVSPKEFARVTRFLRAVRKLDEGRHASFTETALACGYFDQAHFNHDFRDLAGMTPADFCRSTNVSY